MTRKQLPEAMAILRRDVPTWDVPVVRLNAQDDHDPYRVLISTILSLRTQDQTTILASERLFKLADTPQVMLQLDVQTIENAIYPVGFYRTKAPQILEMSRRILEEFGGRVPDDIDTLLTLHGVGRKTANLVLSEGYGVPAICVDTHVHRISNRWGYVKTKDPYETEMALRKKLPKAFWIEYNPSLVALGQYVCKPASPICSQCPVADFCKRVGVQRSR
ncbi:MAG: endonuclease III [Candidatus Entotheonella gemina]|uniref:Endonuclease III n=1 Tax=Candidatus Entotheonella gemina TaxID=1429439 RepID=W4M336_9BACT|nr:MAG: endonuclease III [Candidatus Entotheonella gemina]